MVKHKIAFLIPNIGSPGGAERVLTTLANELSKNYDVHILSFIDCPPFYPVENRIKITPCVKEIKPSANPIEGLKSNYTLFKEIRSIILLNEIEVLISFLTSANVLSSIIRKINNTPVIISERNNPKKQNLSMLWNLLRRLTYPYADYVVVQTPTIKEFFIKKIDQKRLLELPNPISPQLTKLRDKTYKKENIILSVGRLTSQKAQHILIESFALLKNKKWKLIIIGEGPDRLKLEILIDNLNLSDQVFLVGQQKDIHNYYNKAKIFAFSSLYEGFPNALIEAMHFGLACVSTDCPTGPSELINNGENGFLVPINNVTEMVEKLADLMDNQAKREQFGEKGIQTVKKYEAYNVVNQWEHIIKNLIKEF